MKRYHNQGKQLPQSSFIWLRSEALDREVRSSSSILFCPEVNKCKIKQWAKSKKNTLIIASINEWWKRRRDKAEDWRRNSLYSISYKSTGSQPGQFATLLLYPSPRLSETVRQHICFKPLCFGVICYITMRN